MKKRDTAIEIISFLFIILFIYAAIMKLMDVEKFRIQIGQSPLLSADADLIAWVVPSIEILISLMLTFSRWRLVGLYAASGLMIMFTTYIVVILNFSENIPCSCGGVLEQLGWSEHLIFNIGFTLLGLAGIIIHTKEKVSNPEKTDTDDAVVTT